MEIKFFRKQNALSIKNAKTKQPTKNELIENLIKKLSEKTHQIEIIYTKNLRDDYLKKKGKYEESLNMSETKIKSLLAERVAIDILQIFKDISRFYNVDFTSKTTFKTKNEAQVKEELEKLNITLLNAKNITKKLQDFYNLFVSYCNIFEFKINTIEIKQQEIEKIEGSFFEGLFVIFEQ